MTRLARFAWTVLLGNVAVILWGGFVRATGSGAGCGSHWPTCNGVVVPRSGSVATLIEVSHRFTSGAAFGAVLLLLALIFVKTPRRHPARRSALYAMLFMLGEVVIGAAIVLLGHVAMDPSALHGVFTELHAGNTFLLLGALTLTGHHLSRGTDAAPLRIAGRRGLVLTLAQAFLGLALTFASGAIAALGDTLFPSHSLREGLTQDLSKGAHMFLHLRTLHPIFALIAFVLVVGAASDIRGRDDVSKKARSRATLVITVVSVQMLLGAVNLWLLVPVATQILHLACADALFISLVLLTAHALSGDRIASAGQGTTSMSTRRSVRHLPGDGSESSLPAEAVTSRSVETP